MSKRRPAQQEHYDAGYAAAIRDVMFTMAPKDELVRRGWLCRLEAIAQGRLHGTMGPEPKETDNAG